MPQNNNLEFHRNSWNLRRKRRACAPHYVTNSIKKPGQLNFQNLYFFCLAFADMMFRCLCGRGKHERRAFCESWFWPTITVTASRRPPVPDYSPHSAPAQAGPYNIYQGRGLAFRNWVSLSQCQSVSSLYLYFSCSNFFLLNTLLNQNYPNLPAIVIFRNSMFRFNHFKWIMCK